MNKILVKLTVIIFFGIVGNVCNTYAQGNPDKSSINLHFVYIAHEITTPVNELCARLTALQEDAIEINDALIIYLSDGKASIVTFTNLKDVSDKGRDKDIAFIEVISALQDANSHDVIASYDVENIINLFEEYNFVNDEGGIIYNNVTFDFYVGKSFWTLGNNEKVISHLYHDFSMANLPKNQFVLNIYVPKSDHLRYPQGMPFGDNNVENINNKVKILEY
ncbi:MAG: hypothetical protein HUJ68_12235 [Clostridia bacterium]|nr:hypothetical protein [Clostridia bacterium]